MSQYQYGTLFDKLGIPGMGHQGSGWCAIDPNGVLVLMAHQEFFQTRAGNLFYDSPGDERLPTVASSAARSIKLQATYFKPGRDILLPVGIFSFDGGFGADGKHAPSKFKHATGDVFRAKMLEFDPKTGRVLCEVTEKFSV